MKAVADPVILLPMGEIHPIIPKIVAAHISGYLNLSSTILPTTAVPASAFDPNRCQFDALRLIRYLESGHSDTRQKMLALIDADIFIPIFTHVMGEARQGGAVGIVSLYRLARGPDGSPSPPETFYERTVKVALHELGHLLNGRHCEAPQCLMHFAGTLDDLDRIVMNYCRYCRLTLKEAAFKALSEAEEGTTR